MDNVRNTSEPMLGQSDTAPDSSSSTPATPAARAVADTSPSTPSRATGQAESQAKSQAEALADLARRVTMAARRAWDASVRWLVAHVVYPGWLPDRWRSPWVGYGFAAASTVALGLVLLLIAYASSGTIQLAAPLLLLDVLVAILFGSGPSLLAALLGVLLLDYVIFMPHFTWSHTDPGKAFILLVFGVVGCAISLLASREGRSRERAEALAGALRASQQETVRRMDEFMGVAGHELKTPLTSLTANVQIAKRSARTLLATLTAADDSPPDRQALERRLTQIGNLLDAADRQAQRQDRLVNDLLDMSRSRADKLPMELGAHDLALVVRETVQEQRQVHPGRQIHLDVALPEGITSVPVQADRDRIGQVLTNYLSNALKYSPEDAPVVVSLSLEANPSGSESASARVAVRDQGPGLPPDEHARIWDRFHRAPGVAVKSGAGIGLGLGLYISHEIIERHGGKVGVESAPGDGSTFWFALPIAQILPVAPD